MAARVLAVDDDPDVLALLREVLGREGYRVEGAGDGDEALARLRAGRPDLLILDLVLRSPPDGWAILEEVRRDPALAATPVLICTADTFGVAAHKAELRRYRAEVLSKPFHVADLLDLVRRLLGPG